MQDLLVSGFGLVTGDAIVALIGTALGAAAGLLGVLVNDGLNRRREDRRRLSAAKESLFAFLNELEIVLKREAPYNSSELSRIYLSLRQSLSDTTRTSYGEVLVQFDSVFTRLLRDRDDSGILNDAYEVKRRSAFADVRLSLDG